MKNFLKGPTENRSAASRRPRGRPISLDIDGRTGRRAGVGAPDAGAAPLNPRRRHRRAHRIAGRILPHDRLRRDRWALAKRARGRRFGRAGGDLPQPDGGLPRLRGGPRDSSSGAGTGFPFAAKPFNDLTLHPRALKAVGQLLERDETALRLTQAGAGAKYGGMGQGGPTDLGGSDQGFHRDYGKGALRHYPHPELPWLAFTPTFSR